MAAVKATTVIAWVGGILATIAIGFIIWEQVQKAKKKKELLTDGNPNGNGGNPPATNTPPGTGGGGNGNTIYADPGNVPVSTVIGQTLATAGTSVNTAAATRVDSNYRSSTGYTLNGNSAGNALGGGNGTLLVPAGNGTVGAIPVTGNTPASGVASTNFGGVFKNAPIAITGIVAPGIWDSRSQKFRY